MERMIAPRGHVLIPPFFLQSARLRLSWLKVVGIGLVIDGTNSATAFVLVSV